MPTQQPTTRASYTPEEREAVLSAISSGILPTNKRHRDLYYEIMGAQPQAKPTQEITPREREYAHRLWAEMKRMGVR